MVPARDRWVHNPRDRGWSCPPVGPAVIAFHRSLPAYRPTRLVALPGVASELGVARVLAKDESDRLGLPAFKALGASWAMHRALAAMGRPDGAADDPVTFVTATDGNHGRAVARMARLLGHRARVTVPDGVSAGAIAAIEAEGARVDVVGGSYDDAVGAAAALARRTGGVLLQDTAWPGYETVPGWIVEGYATLFAEVDERDGGAGVWGRPTSSSCPSASGRWRRPPSPTTAARRTRPGRRWSRSSPSRRRASSPACAPATP